MTITRILHFIDSLSAWTGKAFAWCIVILTFSTCYEVFMRYVLNAPTTRIRAKTGFSRLQMRP